MTQGFKPNRYFRRDYDRLFSKNPAGANMLLLLCELADDKGQVITDETELAQLFSARFEDPRAYSLPMGPER